MWHHLDLRDPSRLEEILDTVAPAVVINATSGGADWAVTAEGGIRLAQAATERGRYELGGLIARRDGLDSARLPSARRSDTGLLGGLDVRLDSRTTQEKLRTRLRGAREFLRGNSPELT